MILILSKSSLEPTTEEVIDWLERFGERVVRINGEDLDGGADLFFRIQSGRMEIRLEEEDFSLDADAIKAVWWRRWLNERMHESVDLLGVDVPQGHRVQFEIKKHLGFEARKLEQFFFSRFRRVPWLSDNVSSSPNKLEVLEVASLAGLEVPATIVTTRKSDLERFLLEVKRVVVKPIGEADMFVMGDTACVMYTSVLEDPDVVGLPDRFRASLFQEELSKEYEIRVFFLAGEIYSMAIFSQGHDQTRNDFRRYSQKKPNRCVPYQVRAGTAMAVKDLMGRLGLETGSIDLVRTRDGRDVFLEVNPVGQFGMVSKPCNYPLEKRVAEVLLAKAASGEGI